MRKRAFERIPVNLEAKFSCHHEDYTGKITNVSENGMFIQTEMNFPFEPQFEIHILHKGNILKVPVKIARVVKTKNFYDGIGVEIIEQTEGYLEFVNDLKIFF